MKKSIYAICAVSLSVLFFFSCSRPVENVFLERAENTMKAIYEFYGSEGTFLLRENYPFDHEYKAGYLASQEQASKGNPYSYLWPFSGTLSAVAAIMESEPSWQDTLESRVLPGLREYLDCSRKPCAYSSYINSAPLSDRFYDDNVWLGIDFTDLYVLTGKKDYLEQAEMIWKFIESGTDDVLGGGIYWCEQKKVSKNTCSNAPGAVYALKLYKATGDKAYLESGKELYDWTLRTLKDTTDALYLDNINLDGKIADWKFAYNSGQMIQAAALLYGITGNKAYLDEASQTAKACYGYFFEYYEREDGTSVRILKRGNVWFSAVMLRGLIELYKIDGNPDYVEAVRNTLDVAWEKGKSEEGLFGDSFKEVAKDKKKWLLTQGAMAEMYARIAALEK